MKCAWASIDENKKTHCGKAGNQSGSELKTGAYYDFGQKYIARAKDPELAYLIADAVYQIVIKRCVGYDQYQRETLYVALDMIGWDAAALDTLCECDCSELAVCGINCAVKRALIAADTYSGNLVERCKATGLFDIIKITKKTVIEQGDIIIAPNKHVIIAIGSLKEPARKMKWQAGKTYTCREAMNVRVGAGTNKRIKEVRELSADGQKHAVNKDPESKAVLKAGTRVTCKKVVEGKNGYVWLQIPSGYICATNGEKYYVY